MIQPSKRSCSTASATTASTSAAGMTTAPSMSATITSLGITATPPQPTGSCQPTKVSPATDAGAAVPRYHTGSPVPSTPARSRITPSVTSPATPRFFMRAHRMSPKMPASTTPMASTTAIQPAGMASIAARVEIGAPHDAGVARSSRAGTKRSVKARPTRRACSACSGLAPRIQTLRSPFFSKTVVSVAVLTPASTRTSSGSSGRGSVPIGKPPAIGLKIGYVSRTIVGDPAKISGRGPEISDHHQQGIFMKPVAFAARDGHTLAAYRFDPDGPVKAHVIIAAAMAVPQSFYAAFARHLANRGYTAWTFDYRGIGESLTGSLRHVK